MTDINAIKQEIRDMESRIEFLNTDKTKYVSAWAGGTGYDHGPYYRRLEKKKLKAKIRRRKLKLKKLLKDLNL